MIVKYKKYEFEGCFIGRIDKIWPWKWSIVRGNIQK